MSNQSTDVQSAWAFWILEEAAQSQCVLDGLLGMSAFHLRRLQHSDRGHQLELSGGLNKGNVSSVAATCAIVSFHTYVNRYFLADEDSQRMPHHWFLSFQRSTRLLSLTLPLIQNSMVRQEFRGFNTTNRTMEHGTHDNPFSFLLYFHPPSVSPDQEEISICMQAVVHLSYLHADLTTRKPLCFPAAVSTRFVDLIAAKNPRALAISGYYFMLIKEGQQFWWVDGAPEREFALIMSHLPQDWWPAMDWAIRTLGWTEQ
ncbi:hypothetical protein EDB81DRAFT_841690 [Dactylonectria macrodidyma]|uniref:Uncharacterized protein n=1 Tax=Dactylonectria macrodidyma TaxID=307937 RepID=A0A9P9F6E0_9HYPO|nr:hypothetical protein EDB81DRAFT_841690 [Dactylonectria macrodidyma]